MKRKRLTNSSAVDGFVMRVRTRNVHADAAKNQRRHYEKLMRLEIDRGNDRERSIGQQRRSVNAAKSAQA